MNQHNNMALGLPKVPMINPDVVNIPVPIMLATTRIMADPTTEVPFQVFVNGVFGFHVCALQCKHYFTSKVSVALYFCMSHSFLS